MCKSNQNDIFNFIFATIPSECILEYRDKDDTSKEYIERVNVTYNNRVIYKPYYI